jgi:hypothetical protein
MPCAGCGSNNAPGYALSLRQADRVLSGGSIALCRFCLADLESIGLTGAVQDLFRRLRRARRKESGEEPTAGPAADRPYEVRVTSEGPFSVTIHPERPRAPYRPGGFDWSPVMAPAPRAGETTEPR